MRTLKALLFVSILACVPLARAAQNSPIVTKMLQDKIAGSTTVSYCTNGNTQVPKYVIKVTPGQPVTLEFYAKGTNSGTETMTFLLANSNTGTNFDLGHQRTVAFSLVSATAPGVLVTNIDTGYLGAAQYLGIYSGQNGHASYVDVKVVGSTAANNQ